MRETSRNFKSACRFDNHVLKEFIINKFITLRLEKAYWHDGSELQTIIYVNDDMFIQCTYLLANIPVREIASYDDIDSIDDLAERLDKSLEPSDITRKRAIPIEVEFWGHCSNLQVWVENKYDSRLLHSNLSFPLLKRLSEVGDPLAEKVFKEEIAKRFIKGNPTVLKFLMKEDYLSFLTQEEILTIFQEINPESLSEEILFKLLKKHPFIEKNNLEIQKFLREEYCHGKHVTLGGKKYFVSYGKLSLGNSEIRDISDVKGLKELTKLRELSLSGKGISEIKDLGSLIHLRKLFLKGNKIKRINGLENLTRLTALLLEWNQIEEISGLDSLESLLKLDLRGNNIKEIKGLEKLKYLKDLYLSGNQITEISGLENLPNLISLDLSDNRIKEIKGLESVGKLFFLSLYKNLIKKVKGLEGIKDLVHFEIGKNNIPQELIDRLGGMMWGGRGRVENAKAWVNYCRIRIRDNKLFSE